MPLVNWESWPIYLGNISAYICKGNTSASAFRDCTYMVNICTVNTEKLHHNIDSLTFQLVEAAQVPWTDPLIQAVGPWKLTILRFLCTFSISWLSLSHNITVALPTGKFSHMHSRLQTSRCLVTGSFPNMQSGLCSLVYAWELPLSSIHYLPLDFQWSPPSS